MWGGLLPSDITIRWHGADRGRSGHVEHAHGHAVVLALVVEDLRQVVGADATERARLGLVAAGEQEELVGMLAGLGHVDLVLAGAVRRHARDLDVLQAVAAVVAVDLDRRVREFRKDPGLRRRHSIHRDLEAQLRADVLEDGGDRRDVGLDEQVGLLLLRVAAAVEHAQAVRALGRDHVVRTMDGRFVAAGALERTRDLDAVRSLDLLVAVHAGQRDHEDLGQHRGREVPGSARPSGGRCGGLIHG